MYSTAWPSFQGIKPMTDERMYSRKVFKPSQLQGVCNLLEGARAPLSAAPVPNLGSPTLFLRWSVPELCLERFKPLGTV